MPTKEWKPPNIPRVKIGSLRGLTWWEENSERVIWNGIAIAATAAWIGLVAAALWP